MSHSGGVWRTWPALHTFSPVALASRFSRALPWFSTAHTEDSVEISALILSAIALSAEIIAPTFSQA